MPPETTCSKKAGNELSRRDLARSEHMKRLWFLSSSAARKLLDDSTIPQMTLGKHGGKIPVSVRLEIPAKTGLDEGYLPDYLPGDMTTAHFTLLNALYSPPNGKLDPAALSVPSYTRAPLGHRDEAPRTPIEATLSHLWAEILGSDKLEIHDDIIEMGGDSLRASEMIPRVRQRLRATCRTGACSISPPWARSQISSGKAPLVLMKHPKGP
jgi:hypothetical protein